MVRNLNYVPRGISKFSSSVTQKRGLYITPKEQPKLFMARMTIDQKIIDEINRNKTREPMTKNKIAKKEITTE